jgi:Xaa-Pro aminopeptidase
MAFDMRPLRQRRVQQLDALLERHGLAALMISSADFFQFFSNLPIGTQAWERPFVLVLPRAGEPFAVVNRVAEHGMRMQIESGAAWIADLRCYSELAGAAREQVATLVIEGLRERGIAGVLGHDGALSIAPSLGGFELRNIAADLRPLRWIKHETEIAIMQAAAEMADWAMARLRDALRPGRLLQELDYQVSADTMAEAARRLPGENFQITKIVTLSGPGSASTDGDGAPTGAVVRANTPTVSVVVTRLNGYSVEVHRTFVCGRLPAEHALLLQCAIDINAAAVEQAFAGNRLSAIDAAAQQTAAKASFDRHLAHRAGHGIGVATHEFPEDIPINPRPIEQDEVFSLEPGLYVRGVGGFRIGDAVVAEARPRLLTAAPKRLADLVLG